ncbi:NADH:flavin oxidoreductase/NADH oxidase [Halapricum desulfuricans]|uniref:NADH:flavin oxidoreductase, Old Yellow Enzyme family n=1 Tax=Halapricum desulfuricans TaxID=2841257 RepID=A0A897NN43_9EURY|nr:NADH:flavin oxidoreductase/NADH oxidase [Halapricum desulfuricans]QSG13854.1 NADH:flavin oxidoreductase, Old Yellow Enzyme family [Halapricum desulfuricans]
MTALFSSLNLRETSIPNRVMVSPMCQYSCEQRDGLATEWHRTHLGSRAVGGAGLVMSEATAVEPRGRISPEDLGIWSDEHAEALEPITEFIREQGSVPGIQLAHAGRKASTSRPWEDHGPVAPEDGGWTVVGPTDEPWPYDDEAPSTERLTPEDIESVVGSFRTAAERALAAGFEVAEVHAAHGYLIHEFLSPVTNTRGDAYGGGFEGRTRLAREVTAAVREVWPDDKPVFVRISATDWLPDRESWTVADSVRLADRLADLGADLIDVSAGGIHPESSPERAGPNYQVRYAERVREETDREVAVGAVGGITTPEQAEAVVANERADMAIVGREHLRDPYFTLRAAEALDATDEIEGPPQYRRAFGF